MTQALSAALGALESALQAVPPGDLPAALAELERLRLAALPRLFATATDGKAPARPEETADKLFTVKQAAEVLACTQDWLYRAARRLPFTVRLGPQQIRFSSRGIQRFIRLRQGAEKVLTGERDYGNIPICLRNERKPQSGRP